MKKLKKVDKLRDIMYRNRPVVTLQVEGILGLFNEQTLPFFIMNHWIDWMIHENFR